MTNSEIIIGQMNRKMNPKEDSRRGRDIKRGIKVRVTRMVNVPDNRKSDLCNILILSDW